jgi:hypothetical protein
MSRQYTMVTECNKTIHLMVGTRKRKREDAEVLISLSRHTPNILFKNRKTSY